MFLSLQICTLKVDITCCDKCPIKLKKKLMKTNGVIGVDIDSNNETVRVVGDIDPTILMQMFEKMGKPAELLSFHKVPSQRPSQRRTSTGGNNNNKREARFACDDDFSSYNYNHDNENDPRRGGPGPNHTQMEGGGGFGWRGGFAPSNSSRFSGVFPNPLYCPGPAPAPSGYYRQPPPPLPPRSTYGGYGYGYFPSRSRQKFNPMTHYTSYWDNHRLSP
ncbi:hypothetical protein FH972_004858 [Carpinus fangiana]|uniref:HMA domain-containing protein n=1 Tax=Carpinus fangiana TaxID=176857 RepID=A0A5N6QMG6_9ROSI|nr:hypothetical protein FH972_004858 [Carpinus fangiana]